MGEGVTRTVDLQCCQLTRRPAARSVNNHLLLFCYPHADTHLTAALDGSCAACKSHGKEWLFLVNLRGRTRQLAPVVSTSARPQPSSKSNPPRRRKSLLLLTEGEPVQSANVCFLCNLLHLHSSGLDLPAQKPLFAGVWCLLTQP